MKKKKKEVIVREKIKINLKILTKEELESTRNKAYKLIIP